MEISAIQKEKQFQNQIFINDVDYLLEKFKQIDILFSAGEFDWASNNLKIIREYIVQRYNFSPTSCYSFRLVCINKLVDSIRFNLALDINKSFFILRGLISALMGYLNSPVSSSASPVVFAVYDKSAEFGSFSVSSNKSVVLSYHKKSLKRFIRGSAGSYLRDLKFKRDILPIHKLVDRHTTNILHHFGIYNLCQLRQRFNEISKSTEIIKWPDGGPCSYGVPRNARFICRDLLARYY